MGIIVGADVGIFVIVGIEVGDLVTEGASVGMFDLVGSGLACVGKRSTFFVYDIGAAFVF